MAKKEANKIEGNIADNGSDVFGLNKKYSRILLFKTQIKSSKKKNNI